MTVVSVTTTIILLLKSLHVHLKEWNDIEAYLSYLCYQVKEWIHGDDKSSNLD
jgi:hypothetical protein